MPTAIAIFNPYGRLKNKTSLFRYNKGEHTFVLPFIFYINANYR